MSDLTLAQLAAMSDGRLDNVPDPERRLSAPVVVDSRQVEPGGVFVAIAGARVNGHAFARDAISAGAVLVMATDPLDGVPTVLVDDPVAALGRLATAVLRQRPELTVVGITGSNGKTTTKDLLAGVLATHGETVAAPGSYNGEIGLPLSVLRSTPSTRYLVLEYGARGIGHIAYLTEIARPNVAVVLNVGVAHIGEFGGTGAILAAKAELVEALTGDGIAVLNADDLGVMTMRERTGARVMTFSAAGRDADVTALAVSIDGHGLPSFQLRTGEDSYPVKLRLHGQHQIQNACAAAAAALAVGLDPGAVADALSKTEPLSRWRMEVTETADGVTVVNDAYNANPNSMRAGLTAVIQMRGTQAERRIWLVLGPMAELGTTTERAHHDVGRFAAQMRADRIVAVGPQAVGYLEGARTVGASADCTQQVADVDAAVALLRSELEPGDIVYVKASRSAGLERVALALVEPVPA